MYDTKDLGPAPVISNLCRQLKIRTTINRIVPWDPKQCQLDPGLLAVALIINLLCRRNPLYLVEEFYQEHDVELLFGPEIKAEYFNDDALGRTLDKIYLAGAKKAFSAVSLQAQVEENIHCRVLHADTTARLVYGEYPHEQGLNITFGYNKENRRDLKQFKVGAGVNQDGFPFLGEVLDGNLDDKTWNKQLLENLPENFTVEQLQQVVYVAGSAPVTENNLQATGELKFISRLPERFKLATRLTWAAFDKDQWIDLGQLAPGKKSATYKAQEFVEELFGHNYRFVVVYSSQLDGRTLRGLNRRLEKQKTALQSAIKKIMKLTFSCEDDAKDALARFLKNHDQEFYPIKSAVVKSTEKLKRNKRGRPANNETPHYRDVYRLQLQIGELNEARYQRERERLSTFVLISNIFARYDAYGLLREYKQQTIVENRFKFIKHPLYVGSMLLHKNERMEALSYVVLMALAVYIVLQRRVRKALEQEQDPLDLPGKKKSFEPTGNKVLELFNPVSIVVIIEDNKIVKRFLPERFEKRLGKLLRLIGFDAEIFTKPRSP